MTEGHLARRGKGGEEDIWCGVLEIEPGEISTEGHKIALPFNKIAGCLVSRDGTHKEN